jgi:tetratricopeptide (TPR) repeat protein
VKAPSARHKKSETTSTQSSASAAKGATIEQSPGVVPDAAPKTDGRAHESSPNGEGDPDRPSSSGQTTTAGGTTVEGKEAQRPETPKVNEGDADGPAPLKKGRPKADPKPGAASVGSQDKPTPGSSRAGKLDEAAKAFMAAGDTHIARSAWKAGATAYGKAEAAYKQTGCATERARALLLRAYCEVSFGDSDAAKKSMDQAHRLLRDSKPKDLEALQLFVSGMSCRHEGNPGEALKKLSESLNGFRAVGDDRMVARALVALSALERIRCRFEAAITHAGDALKQFAAIGDEAGAARASLSIAEIYNTQGFLQKSLDYAQQASAAALKSGDEETLAEAGALIADVRMSLGDAESALKVLRETLDQVKGTENRRVRARVRMAVAKFRLAGESIDRVIEAVNAARADFVAVKDRRGIADCDAFQGMAAEMRGDRAGAAPLLEKALAEHRALWDVQGEGADLAALGVYHKNIGEIPKALRYFEESLELRRRIGDARGEAAALANLGNLHKHRGRAAEALKNLQTALEIYRRVSDKKGEADILTNLGNVLAADRSYAEALERIEEAIQIHREIRDVRGETADLIAIARLRLQRGELEAARASLDEAAKLSRRIGAPSRTEIAILGEQATLRQLEKRTPQALSLLEKALKLAEKNEDKRAAASLNLKMAGALREAGDLNAAHKILVKAVEIMKTVGDRYGELWALGELGLAQARLEDYDKALATLQQAVELFDRLGLPQAQSRDLDYHLGEIYEAFGDYDQAVEHHQRALAGAQSVGDLAMQGRVLDRLGNAHYRIEDYARARDLYEDALRIHSETKNLPMQKNELIRLGDITSRLGDPEASLKHFQRALTLTREGGDGWTESRVLTRMGTLHQLLGRPRIALDHYRDAYEKRAGVGDTRGANENLLQIALVTALLGNFDEATANIKAALEWAHGAEDRNMLWKAYFIMGRVLQGKNRLGEALEAYRKAVSVLETTEGQIVEDSDEDTFIFGGRSALFETTLGVLMNLARKDTKGAYDKQAFAMMEKLKSYEFESDFFRIGAEHFPDIPQELRMRERNLRLALKTLNERLAQELAKPAPTPGTVRKLNAERRERERAFAELRETMRRNHPAYAALKYPQPIAVDRFQRDVLDQDEILVSYMVTRSRTYIFAVDKNKFFPVSVDYPRDALQKDVHDLMRPLFRSDSLESWDPSIAHRLYTKLFKPIESFAAMRKAVLIVPHGPLCGLPFETLVTSEDHAGRRFWSAADRPAYLLEKHALTYLPTVSSLVFLRSGRRADTPGWSLAAFGDPVYEEGGVPGPLNPGAEKLLTFLPESQEGARKPPLRNLAGARDEVTEISKIVEGPVQRYFGANATETLLKKADLGRYAYVHLAALGLFANGSQKAFQQPSVVLSLFGDGENDGFLQLSEVVGLKLNADLVVISACHISDKDYQGPPAGVGALARAFIFAGADSIMLATWPAPEEAVKKILSDMYARLKTGSKAEALRFAKLSLLKSEGMSHPYYWAPVTLFGDWKVAYPPGFNKTDDELMRYKGVSRWRKLLGRQ